LVDGELVAGSLELRDGRIARVHRAPEGSARGPESELGGDELVVSPGLVDLQVNGSFGIDVAAEPQRIDELATHLVQVGVTAFLPTVISAPAEVYETLEGAWRKLPYLPSAGRGDDLHEGRLASGGARPLGLHLEGPYLSPHRVGVHPAMAVAGADQGLPEGALLRWLRELRVGDGGPGALRIMTLAPERAGGLARIALLRAHGAIASCGHTDASYEELRAGIDAGATMATHLFNAMSPLHHRLPGAVGAVLDDPRIVTSVIADGAHVHPAALRLAHRLKGPRGLVLVSDSVAEAAPRSVRAQATNATAKANGVGVLAGSLVPLDEAVARFADAVGDPAAALRAATELPAALLGLTHLGRLAAGAVADLAVFDAQLALRAVLCAGEVVHRRDP
jgi:N-acetylglucosamine-6-phosphate deacetylase